MRGYKIIALENKMTIALLFKIAEAMAISKDGKIGVEDLKIIQDQINRVAREVVLGKSTRTPKEEIDYSVNFANDKLEGLIAIAKERGKKNVH